MDYIYRKSCAIAIACAVVLLAARPAAAQVIAMLGTEIASWASVFDVSFVPVAIMAGLIGALLIAAFSRLAGVVVFVFVVIGAFAYGTRDYLYAAAGV